MRGTRIVGLMMVNVHYFISKIKQNKAHKFSDYFNAVLYVLIIGQYRFYTSGPIRFHENTYQNKTSRKQVVFNLKKTMIKCKQLFISLPLDP